MQRAVVFLFIIYFLYGYDDIHLEDQFYKYNHSRQH